MSEHDRSGEQGLPEKSEIDTLREQMVRDCGELLGKYGKTQELQPQHERVAGQLARALEGKGIPLPEHSSFRIFSPDIKNEDGTLRPRVGIIGTNEDDGVPQLFIIENMANWGQAYLAIDTATQVISRFDQEEREWSDEPASLDEMEYFKKSVVDEIKNMENKTEDLPVSIYSSVHKN